MQVTICGPNLKDQSRGQFHVHAANCADLKKGAKKEPAYKSDWTIETDTVEAIVTEVYSDMINGSDSDEGWGALRPVARDGGVVEEHRPGD